MLISYLYLVVIIITKFVLLLNISAAFKNCGGLNDLFSNKKCADILVKTLRHFVKMSAHFILKWKLE